MTEHDALVAAWDDIMTATRNSEGLHCPFCGRASDHDVDCSVPKIRAALTGEPITFEPTDLEDCGK